MTKIKMPRLMISAVGSGCGKTTITCAILKALLKRGLNVAAFKSGPDYIDPMFHSKVIGAKSRNLDIFMLGKETTRFLAAKNAHGMDISIFEGAMGFYDGIGQTPNASAYDLARTCNVPVVLIVNGKGAALSIAAQIKGFKEFRKDSNIVGAIINNINHMTYAYYKDTIEKESGVRLLGYFPILENCNLESRHLGLITAEEIGNLESIIETLRNQAEESLDLKAILELAGNTPDLEYEQQNIVPLGKVKIAIAKDKAFCFYYQDSLDLLTMLGAELIPFSPLTDKALPKCDGLILGGGYPELYAQKLSENISLLSEIKTAIKNGLPCFAECGGFMYLLDSYTTDNTTYKWTGAIHGETFMTKKLTRFGYVKLTAQKDNLLCKSKESINGHEFHYSDSTANGTGFVATKASVNLQYSCVNTSESLYAGYPHIHFWSNPSFARSFVNACLLHNSLS